MTNFEYLCSSAGELATWLSYMIDCKSCPVKNGCEARNRIGLLPVENGCQPRLFDWLMSEKKKGW